ncbi:MAG TPA: Gfo/Idh/MocA family oxidoreductase [Vicinamibacterales bacterium]|nr:Gfo/Idh/MocA family oxidoreductase [Vicinamibacterales bacterium]
MRDVTRREFMAATGGAAAAALLSTAGRARAAGRRRYAIVGTGVRAIGMWGRPIAAGYQDVVEFVGLCDTNPLRVEVAKKAIGVDCPTYTRLEEMLEKARPDVLMVTTVDRYHADCIVSALDRGVDVITEKPMVIDETQCQAVLEAEKRNNRNIVVTFNYRYAPKHQKIKELLMAGEIGTVSSVDFSWYLDVRHGADYFRRWHRLREMSGSLWVHKSTHHFDLINWWLDADPVEVAALGALRNYGKANSFRHTHCRPCPHKSKCAYHWDITKDQRLVDLYVNCESADGYLRDGCVFREDIDIPDTMNAIVHYSNGVNMSYSVNTFMPIEGYRLAFNGTKGRLEVRDYERQPWDPGEETEMYLIRNFGERVKIDIPTAEGGHGGGDRILLDLVFRSTPVAEHLRLPGSRAGAMSCLTGVAARKSSDTGQPVKIADLVPSLASTARA